MNCNCLCEINHPDKRGICTGNADSIVIFTSPNTGQHDVSMCNPCAEATKEKADLV